ncbi:hypothetical protein M2451_003337 [Dysgonomonas sp. PFB1-18]|uniref:hypothetical protein n=1 Tax=unclassified Dysgonomonas TaxID=2630389 RepID=UPI0024757D82|nr:MULTISPECIES: hypothetical protein [unclassified Dysgonomonas]MDH6310573.1 hypothetical protein [Dysgonomonas sp. PF1-14]MDH6340423.1 hypothetical protein [Dysgonomonas sp. PF1-16]MDH6381997.1 hypothetical protein [Dysgonomonas sp. PFB1-18]MDH6399394.1 hypothetical protein [Dysgonomonas sp. PF1-23]
MEIKQELQTTASKANLPAVLTPAVLTRELKQVKSVSDALALAADSELCPSLAAIRRDYDSETVEDLIMAYLIEMRKMIHAKRHLSDEQIEEIALEVVSTYYYFTIADIHLIFKWAKMGKYGTLYESIDMPKVMNWFEKYDDMRSQAVTQENENSQFHDKGGNMTPQRMTKYFDTMQDKFSKSKK